MSMHERSFSIGSYRVLECPVEVLPDALVQGRHEGQGQVDEAVVQQQVRALVLEERAEGRQQGGGAARLQQRVQCGHGLVRLDTEDGGGQGGRLATGMKG